MHSKKRPIIRGKVAPVKALTCKCDMDASPPIICTPCHLAGRA